jgi:hypothetical protein
MSSSYRSNLRFVSLISIPGSEILRGSILRRDRPDGYNLVR